MKTELFIATRAFIIFNSKILIIRESMLYESPNKGKYDLPGGKVRPNESVDRGLAREVMEETGLLIKIGKPFSVCEWNPEVRGIKNHIVGIFFECFADSDKVMLSKDHDRCEWIDPSNFGDFDIINTDVKAFRDYLGF